jgi:hypothetical protein
MRTGSAIYRHVPVIVLYPSGEVGHRALEVVALVYDSVHAVFSAENHMVDKLVPI